MDRVLDRIALTVACGSITRRIVAITRSSIGEVENGIARTGYRD